MNFLIRPGAACGLAFAILATAAAAKPLSDLASPEKRRTVVDLAQHLTRVPEAVPVPADLPNLFNPQGFEQPDPEEVKAAAAASNRGAPAPGGGGAPVVRPPGEREILENLAAKLPTTGSVVLNGEPVLFLGRGKVKVGDKFTVAYNGQDYELELVAIDRTTFTLRYHGEEITRSIKLGKSP